jgi:diguanylate cyclase
MVRRAARMMIAKHRLVLIGGIVAVAIYLLASDPLFLDVFYEVVGLAAVAAILAGARTATKGAPWRLSALGQLLFVAGDVLWVLYARVWHINPWPSWADALYLAGYPVLGAALWLLLRSRSSARRLPAFLDAAIIATAIGVLAWVYYMQPLAQDPSLSLPERLISLAYPLMDLLLLIVLVRMLLIRGARSGSMGWMVASTCLLLGADAWFTLLSTTSGYQPGDLVDGLWLLAYVFWGVAALHPSTVGEAPQHPEVAVKPSRLRIALLATAGLVLPALLWYRAAHGLDNEPALAFGSLLVFSLIAIRMALLVREVEAKAATLVIQSHALEAALAKKHELEERLRRQAFYDNLTGLPNRALFGDRLQQALLRGDRSLHRVALLFIDVDDFKWVNDSHGHCAGDRVLRQIGARLSGCMRKSDTVARWGGDEFAVLIEDADGREAAVEAAERIQTAMAEPFASGAGDLHLGVSVGMVLEGAGDADAMLSAADAAMYAVKRAGKDGSRMFEWDSDRGSESRSVRP